MLEKYTVILVEAYLLHLVDITHVLIWGGLADTFVDDPPYKFRDAGTLVMLALRAAISDADADHGLGAFGKAGTGGGPEDDNSTEST